MMLAKRLEGDGMTLRQAALVAGFAYLLGPTPFLAGYPNANLGYIQVAFLGELVFMLWLLIRGGKIRGAAEAPMETYDGVPG